MAKSDARFGYEAKLGRTDHNLSQPFGFTTPPGTLCPIWYDYAMPGDSYYMNHDLPLLRSAVLLAPAMVDVTVHYETFFVPMQLIFQPFEEALFSTTTPWSSNYVPASLLNNSKLPLFDYQAYITVVNSTGGNERAGAFRMADFFSLSTENFITSTYHNFTVVNGDFFPYQIGAYHTIYQRYYRLDDKSSFSNVFCNFDKFYSQQTFDLSSYSGFLNLHQRPLAFDYFTSAYRSPIVSSSNVGRILPRLTYSDLVNLDTMPIDDIGNGSSVVNDSVNAFAPYQGTNTQLARQQGMSTAIIRQAFANEKLAMITGRTKKNYDSQVLAHYGIKVPHDVKHDITLIHHDEFDLKVQEVTSLASTSDAPLGELAGKSYAAGTGKKFKFTAPCHGVIMTIFSVEPHQRYKTNFDRINQIQDCFDFPTPEFDRLGNMPMFRYEIGTNFNSTTFDNSDVVAWKERYYAFKRKYPKVTTAFMGPGFTLPLPTTYNMWSAYMKAVYPFSDLLNGAHLEPRPDVESRYYIAKNMLDNLCSVFFLYGWEEGNVSQGEENWSYTPWMVYSRDPFIVDSYVHCKKVSWMSKDGEPIYD